MTEVCWEDGDAWPTLANALGVAAPEVPFPKPGPLSPAPEHSGRNRALAAEQKIRLATRSREALINHALCGRLVQAWSLV